ncbi:MAG: Gfo/Idh/MocA family oxidoreductase, partial [Oscillospiraceae bacterium]|nr:Gfo/Idh/MocA family oxidoreductase [Oscillospiraceae bacterium]
MIKVVLIGCGAISMAHISAFEKTRGAQIVAVCDVSEEKVNMAVQKTGAQGFFDYKQMITETNPDLAVITLPHALHCEAVCFCAEHGIDVFVEKPMGIS